MSRPHPLQRERDICDIYPFSTFPMSERNVLMFILSCERSRVLHPFVLAQGMTGENTHLSSKSTCG